MTKDESNQMYEITYKAISEIADVRKSKASDAEICFRVVHIVGKAHNRICSIAANSDDFCKKTAVIFCSIVADCVSDLLGKNIDC